MSFVNLKDDYNTIYKLLRLTAREPEQLNEFEKLREMLSELLDRTNKRIKILKESLNYLT